MNVKSLVLRVIRKELRENGERMCGEWNSTNSLKREGAYCQGPVSMMHEVPAESEFLVNLRKGS